MSTNTAVDLFKLYKTYFNNSPYFVAEQTNNKTAEDIIGYNAPLRFKNDNPRGSIHYSSKNIAFNKIGAYGQAIWFPITFKTTVLEKGSLKTSSIEIEACTVAVNLSKTIIRTAVSERKGTVKECFSIDDYRFGIKGFLIGKNRMVPEDQINLLKQIFESTEPVQLKGGYVELFMNDSSCKVAVSALDFPEVQGKATWIRPFSMTVETDFIDELIIT